MPWRAQTRGRRLRMPGFAPRLSWLFWWSGDLAGIVAGQTAVAVVHLDGDIGIIGQEPVDALAFDSGLVRYPPGPKTSCPQSAALGPGELSERERVLFLLARNESPTSGPRRPRTSDPNFGAVNTQGNHVMVGVGEHIGQRGQPVAFRRQRTRGAPVAGGPGGPPGWSWNDPPRTSEPAQCAGSAGAAPPRSPAPGQHTQVRTDAQGRRSDAGGGPGRS